MGLQHRPAAGFLQNASFRVASALKRANCCNAWKLVTMQANAGISSADCTCHSKILLFFTSDTVHRDEISAVETKSLTLCCIGFPYNTCTHCRKARNQEQQSLSTAAHAPPPYTTVLPFLLSFKACAILSPYYWTSVLSFFIWNPPVKRRRRKRRTPPPRRRRSL